MRRALIATSVLALVLGVGAPASASGPVPPPTFPDNPTIAFFYDMWFGDQPAGTAPTGTIVADSGFRPYPNGLPYANYGNDLSTNALFFGTPGNELQPMDSEDMRSLYGDGVCLTLRNTVKGGPCDLTPAAKYWSQFLLQSVNAVGHCVGMAVVTAAIYNGQLNPSVVGASTLANQSQLSVDTQSEILRQWSTQFTTTRSHLTPSGVVRKLIRTLKPGTVPSTIIITWPTASGGQEGHGITPYAIYDQGGGVYDIAVYDNNYPGQSRAIHVDTNADTWSYLVSLNPGEPATIAAGDASTYSLGLVSVRDSIARQTCPFCGQVPSDLVAFGPMPSTQTGKVVFGIQDLKGASIPSSRINVLPTLTAPASDEFMLPAVQVMRHRGYTVVLDADDATRSIPVRAELASNSGVRGVNWGRFSRGGRAYITVSQGGEMFAVSSSQATRPTMFQAFQQRQVHYNIAVGGGDAVADGVERYMHLDRHASEFVVGHGENRKGSASVSISLETAAGSVSFRAVNIGWALGQHLVLDYSRWRTVTQTPTLWVRDASTGQNVRPIALTPVG